MENLYAMELIADFNPHPNYNFRYLKSSSRLFVGGYEIEMPYIDKGEYRLISVDYLKEKRIINFDFDASNGALTTKPFK